VLQPIRLGPPRWLAWGGVFAPGGKTLYVLSYDMSLKTGRYLAARMLSVVGLREHARQRPNELSGGQQQRVAIARALAGSPDLLIADEPTGQLDSETGRQIMRLLLTVVRSEGITALIATHDEGLIDLADHVLMLEDGRIRAN
jgi:ABC-type lipoprotein export system ATPase subunit